MTRTIEQLDAELEDLRQIVYRSGPRSVGHHEVHGDEVHHTGTTGHTHTHAATTGQGADDHHTEGHAARHKDGGADELDVEELATAGAGSSVPVSNGMGGVSMTTAKRSILLTAQGGAPSTTSGCSEPTKVETGATVKDYWVLDFAANEQAFWQLAMPDNWDGEVVAAQARFYWTAASGSGTVIWGIKAVSLGNSDALTSAYGTQRTTTDTLITAGDVHITGSTSSTFFSASPNGGELVIVEVERTGGTLGVDARLLAVLIEYTTNAYSD